MSFTEVKTITEAAVVAIVIAYFIWFVVWGDDHHKP